VAYSVYLKVPGVVQSVKATHFPPLDEAPPVYIPDDIIISLICCILAVCDEFGNACVHRSGVQVAVECPQVVHVQPHHPARIYTKRQDKTGGGWVSAGSSCLATPPCTHICASIPWDFTDCSLNVHWLFTEYKEQSNKALYWDLTDSAHWMFTERSLNVHCI
jgi:hypothetical protein